MKFSDKYHALTAQRRYRKDRELSTLLEPYRVPRQRQSDDVRYP